MARRGLGRGPLGSMPLGGATEDVQGMSLKPSATVFRRLWIKRRQAADGLFEPDWQEISSFVKRWGSVERSIDDIKLNTFRNSGFNFVVANDKGKFNKEDNLNSLWLGYLTRYKTLVKVEAGYETAGGTEVPSDPRLGIFVMNQEIPQSADSNELQIPCSSLQVIFDEERATNLSGILNTTLTASEIMAKIRDHTDGAGSFIFRQFITSTSWTIETTTSTYVYGADELRGSAWDLMNDLAEKEAKVLLINRTGGIEYRSRDERTSASAFDFYGLGFPRMNMTKLTDFREAVDKYYTFFRYKYLDADTSTSYVTAGTTTTVSPSSLNWSYGARTYDLESNSGVANTATAQAVVDRLYTELATDVPEEAAWTAKFNPELEVLDKVTASYHSYNLAGKTLWDTFEWESGLWAIEGENFDWNSKGFKVLSLKTDLERFDVSVKGRAI